MRTLLSPWTAFSQAFSDNLLRWRIRGEHFRLDHVTRNASTVRNDEAKGLGKSVTDVSTTFTVVIFKVKVSCITLVDGIRLWLLTWLVNIVAMLLVVCHLTRDVIGYEDS